MIKTITFPEELWPSRRDTVEGKVVELHVRPGDTVGEGDLVAEVEVDKAIIEVESPYNGTVVRVYTAPGSAIKPGDPIADVEVNFR